MSSSGSSRASMLEANKELDICPNIPLQAPAFAEPKPELSMTPSGSRFDTGIGVPLSPAPPRGHRALPSCPGPYFVTCGPWQGACTGFSVWGRDGSHSS